MPGPAVTLPRPGGVVTRVLLRVSGRVFWAVIKAVILFTPRLIYHAAGSPNFELEKQALHRYINSDRHGALLRLAGLNFGPKFPMKWTGIGHSCAGQHAFVGDEMSVFTAYLEEIEKRKAEGLKPKPIDDAALTAEIIAQIKDANHAHRTASLDFLIYNTLPGTTGAAGEKAAFLE